MAHGVSDRQRRIPHNSSSHSNPRPPPQFHLLPLPHSPLRRPRPPSAGGDVRFAVRDGIGHQQASRRRRLDLNLRSHNSPGIDSDRDLRFLQPMLCFFILTSMKFRFQIHDVSHRLPLEFSSASWTIMLDGFGEMLQFFIASSSFTPIMECLQTLRSAPLVFDSILSKCVLLLLLIVYEFLLFLGV